MEKKYDLMTLPSPHFHDKSSTKEIMLTVIIALIPAAVAAVVLFGVKALLLILTCVLTAVISESLWCLIMKKKNTVSDLSCIVTGLLLALNLGTDTSLLQAVIGTFFAIIVVKAFFGGLGRNFANPAIAARVFMLEAFASVTSFSSSGMVELSAGATPLPLLSKGDMASLPSILEMLLGLHGGSIGETCIVALAAGWIFLSVRGVIKWYVPFSYIFTVFVLYLCSSMSFTYALYEILSGGLFLGAIFMATDYVTTPITNKGRVIFAVLCGILTFVIRRFMALPEGVSFSILIMNIFSPLIDRICHPVPLGGSNYVK